MAFFGITWFWRNSPADGQIASLYKSCQTSLQCSAVEHDVSITLPAAQTDVRTQPVDQPILAPTRMRPPECHDVAEQELDHSRFL
ncbi:MAG TPA: hypothetical protein VF337_09105 [Candidatus Limnocylindrales bacterium]